MCIGLSQNGGEEDAVEGMASKTSQVEKALIFQIDSKLFPQAIQMKNVRARRRDRTKSFQSVIKYILYLSCFYDFIMRMAALFITHQFLPLPLPVFGFACYVFVDSLFFGRGRSNFQICWNCMNQQNRASRNHRHCSQNAHK